MEEFSCVHEKHENKSFCSVVPASLLVDSKFGSFSPTYVRELFFVCGAMVMVQCEKVEYVVPSSYESSLIFHAHARKAFGGLRSRDSFSLM